MQRTRVMAASLLVMLVSTAAAAATRLKLNDKGYFETPGLNVTVFADIYPDGHQTGVTVIQHGTRVAANGDLRLEPSPGQWSPMPAGDGPPVVDAASQTITQSLHYPDDTKNRKGFNPIDYPDLHFSYHVSVTPMDGDAFQGQRRSRQAAAGRVGRQGRLQCRAVPHRPVRQELADGPDRGNLPAPGRRPDRKRSRPVDLGAHGARERPWWWRPKARCNG